MQVGFRVSATCMAETLRVTDSHRYLRGIVLDTNDAGGYNYLCTADAAERRNKTRYCSSGLCTEYAPT